MKHITENNTNLLMLTFEEYKVLDKFLIQLGIRSRLTRLSITSDTNECIIQAENPYKNCPDLADYMMSEEGLRAYRK